MMTSNGHKKNSQYEALLSRSLTSPHRDIYTRGLYRLCLKFTTSEDEVRSMGRKIFFCVTFSSWGINIHESLNTYRED